MNFFENFFSQKSGCLFSERDDDFVMNLTLLLSLSFAQCVAIYIYLSGFLLKRTSLPNQTSLNNSTLPPSYQKIVILLGNVTKNLNPKNYFKILRQLSWAKSKV